MNYRSLAVKQLFKLSTDLFNQWKTEPTTHEPAACRYVWMLIMSVFRKRGKATSLAKMLNKRSGRGGRDAAGNVREVLGEDGGRKRKK